MINQMGTLRRPSLAGIVAIGVISILTLATAAIAEPATGPLVPVSGASPLVACTADSGQAGTVFVGSEVEPWITVNPNDQDHLVAAWQQDRWSNGGARGLMSAVSHDGGATWSSTIIPGLSLCSGGQFERTTDPWVSFAANGDVYQSAYSFNPSGGSGDAILVSKSSDGGETWGEPRTISLGFDDNSFNDKESITTDPGNSDIAYVTWAWFNSPNQRAADEAFFFARAIRGGVGFSRTTDGGVTWERPRQLFEKTNAAAAFAQIVVLPNGDLVNVFWLDRVPFTKPNTQGVEQSFSVNVVRSTDKGLTWSKPIEISPHQEVGITDPESGEPIRATGALDIAVDPVTGKLYVVWSHHFPGSTVNSVAMSTSDDGGRSWTPPVKINQTPSDIPESNQQAFIPSVAVSNDGTAAISYFDIRANDAGVDLRTEMFGALCPAAADCNDPQAWDERQLTEAPFDMRQAPRTNRGYFVGDYMGLASAGSARFIAAFAMPHAGDAASIFVRSLEAP